MVKGQPARVDMDYGDIFEQLQFAASIHAEAWRGRVRLLTDVMYIQMNEDVPLSHPDAEVTVNANSEQVHWEFGGGYLLTGLLREGMARSPLRIEAIGGGRYVYLDLELNFQVSSSALPGQQRLEGSRKEKKSWVDPFVGGRALWYVADHWLLIGRADIGGFGVGSELTWNVIARVDYRASEFFWLTAGYRWYDINYEDGSGDQKFVYDTRRSGVVVALTFRLN
jgi:hypothetical protein